ncbi:MAG: HlyD family secretion protein [Paludibacteraceae bacterium]|nr:HlyD family secretion protein [Paludibacteraceae bacterium]
MNKKKNWKVYIPLTAVVVIILIAGIVWYIDYSKYVSTDDAHVDSDNVSVSAKILGRISKVYAEEGDSVKAGMLLAELDSTDLQAQKQQAEAGKAQSEANKAQSEAKYLSDKKNLNVLVVNLSRAQEDFDRAKSQFAGDVISKEQYDHTKKSLESAKAQLESAKAQLEVSKAQVTSSAKTIGTSVAQINIIKTQLSNTKLYAPITGIAAKRWLLPGDIVQPGQSVYTINNNKKFWIIVYLEETKMGNMHIGQNAQFTIDAFPGETFTGKVFSIASNTASQFSLIPSNNASGNFTKVTQRVPIKISIDATESGKKVSSFNYLSGMSSVVKISKK